MCALHEMSLRSCLPPADTGWYPANSGYQTPITSFTSYNSVPDTPANTVGQTLYW